MKLHVKHKFPLFHPHTKQSPKCKETPYTSKKVADAMSTCAGNVKANIIEEAFTIVRYQWDHLEHEREHEQLVHYSQPHYNTARPPPGIGSDLVRHVHHVHRLPGQLHQHQADYPPFVGLDPRVPAALHRPQKAVGPSTASMDANSYLEYQNFDPDLNVMRRRLDRRRRSLTTSATAPLPGWALGKTTEISMQEKRIAGVGFWMRFDSDSGTRFKSIFKSNLVSAALHFLEK